MKHLTLEHRYINQVYLIIGLNNSTSHVRVYKNFINRKNK